LKLLGAGAAAAVAAPLITPAAAAPLFIPSQNLDMGVPRQILTATEMPTTLTTWTNTFLNAEELSFFDEIPMLLVHDEFSPPGWQQFGRERVPAGTTLMVDRPTAERWVENGVGTPGPGAPTDLQEEAAQRQATRAAVYGLRNIGEPTQSWLDANWRGSEVLAAREVMRVEESERGRRWSASIERASARLKGAAGPDWWNDDAT
jgi:hypothetical protein